MLSGQSVQSSVGIRSKLQRGAERAQDRGAHDRRYMRARPRYARCKLIIMSISVSPSVTGAVSQ